MARTVMEAPPAAEETVPLGRTWQGAALRHVAMPLGGIGTGQVSLCGDGSLRQWEIFNAANHLAFVPDSVFTIAATSAATVDGSSPSTVTRILQSREVLDLPPARTPLVNDDAIPDAQRALVDTHGGVQRTTFTGAYPFARVAYLDDALPLAIELEAFSPFIPLDPDASSLPTVLFTFRLRNASSHAVIGELAATLKNVVGWDGITPIHGNHCAQFGGNTNRVVTTDRSTALVMENPALPADDPGRGQMVLATTHADARADARWRSVDAFMRALGTGGAVHPDTGPRRPASHHPSDPGTDDLPSAPGETWNGSIRVPFTLAPDTSTDITYILTWSFPNRYVDFDQATRCEQPAFRRSRLWLGNAYATRFPAALGALDHVVDHQDRLTADSRAWSELVLGGTLPTWLAEFLAAQGALIRSPTIFQTDDGKLYGFEGTLGASTANTGDVGGSCPLNCTHVWNYEQALSRLFPSLERTMRETDLHHAQAPDGSIPHRVIVPLFVRQLWGEPIGAAPKPALDGMLGTILKVYREVRQGAGLAWLDACWPKLRLLLSYIETTWDADGDGVLTGEQPNTYDIAFHGSDMFIGGLWLAALRAMEEMARLRAEHAYADELRERLIRARDACDALHWNGEYYQQVLADDDPRLHQYGTGCLSDQLLGQWWAHQLDLGYILPENHVRQALRSIVRHNTRDGFDGWQPAERVFADGDDAGLLVLTWPRGDRPERPTRYNDEVWTGIEYQVAAHCIMEGLADEGMSLLRAARDRHDGVKRNPYNDIECGDHYARAMSGWSVLDALGGYRHDAVSDALAFAPVREAGIADTAGAVRLPFVTASGWGRFEQGAGGDVTLTALWGTIRIATLTVPSTSGGGGAVLIDGEPVDGAVRRQADGRATVTFPETVVLQRGQTFTLACAAG